MYQIRHAGSYSSHFFPNKKYKRDTVFLLGNNARIYGVVDDDYNCNDTLLNHIEHKNPNVRLHIIHYLGYYSWWHIII